MSQKQIARQEPPQDGRLSRRTLFAGAGAAGALAASAVVLPEVATPLPAAAASPDVESEDGRYRLSAHVLRYYQTARV